MSLAGHLHGKFEIHGREARTADPKIRRSDFRVRRAYQRS